MAVKEIQNARFVNRIDSKYNWQNSNSILRKGELGIVTELNEIKYAFIGDGIHSASEINNSPSTYDKLILYTGQGANYNFNILASKDAIGGIKLKNDDHNILIMQGECLNISDDLLNGWNDSLHCFEFSKLYVKELVTDTEQEQAVFKENQIFLRDNPKEGVQSRPMNNGEYAGVAINNVLETTDGFFGIDNNFILHVLRNGTYYPVPTYDPGLGSEIVSGLITLNPISNVFNVSEPKKLVITRGTVTENYNGLDNDVNLIYPSITLNSQALIYDADSNSYSGTFDGGLTLENAELIKEIPNKIDKDALKEGNDISLTADADTITIGHKEYVYSQAGLENVTLNNGSEFTAIVGIEIENGHITKIITRTFKISI